MQIRQIDRTIIKAVSLVSSSQKYQQKVLIFICLLWMGVAYHSLINPIMFTNPLFIENGSVQTQAYCCQQDHQDKCKYVNQFTATFYVGLYCDNRDMRMMLQSISAVGSVIGVLFIPMLNDLKGRKFSFYVALMTTLIGDIGLFIGIFNKIQILCALGSNAILPLSYSIGSEFFSDSLRQKSMIYYCLAWGLADISVILVYYFLSYWLLYLIFVILLPLSLLFFYFKTFFIQSAHYAINSKHDFQLANETLQKLALSNNANANQLQQAKQVLVQLSRTLQKQNAGLVIKQQQKSKLQNLKIIFKSPKYCKALCCIALIKISYFSFYFGVQGGIERTGFNLGVTCLFIGFGQFIAYSTGSQFIPNLRRLKVIFLTNCLLILLTTAFLFDNINKLPFIVSILLFLSFILSSFNCSAITLIESESYPSAIRSTSIGLAFGLSYMTRIIMPFLIGIFNEHKIPPILASCSLMIIFGVIPPLIADQTFGYKSLQQPLIVKQIYQFKEHLNKIKLITKIVPIKINTAFEIKLICKYYYCFQYCQLFCKQISYKQQQLQYII